MKILNLIFALLPCLGFAQTYPSVAPAMYIINEDGMEEESTE